jgi:hypothetical protein
MILGAFYLLWMLRRVIFGPLREPTSHDNHAGGTTGPPHQPAGAGAHDHDHGHMSCPPVGWHEIAGLAPLMFMIVAVGVYPRPIFEQIQPATRAIVQNIEDQREKARDDAERLKGAGQPISARRGGTGGATPKKAGASPKSKPGAPKSNPGATPETKSGEPKSKAAPSEKSSEKGGQ